MVNLGYGPDTRDVALAAAAVELRDALLYDTHPNPNPNPNPNSNPNRMLSLTLNPSPHPNLTPNPNQVRQRAQLRQRHLQRVFAEGGRARGEARNCNRRGDS